MKLIALCGRRGSGKDTAAKALIQTGYTNVKFAGALKEMLRAYLSYCGMSEECIAMAIEDAIGKELPTPFFKGKTPRYAMQTLGTEWGRDLIHKDIWVSACLLRCRQFDRVVITDCRFPNEVEAVKRGGGVTVRISRERPPANEHISETLIDTLDVDYEIDNNGTIEELQTKLLAIVKEQNT